MELRFCDDCGARINEEDFSSGRAAEVGDYCYCPKCLKAKKKEGEFSKSSAQPTRAPSTKKLIRPTPGGGSRPGPRETPARGTPGRGRKRPPSTTKLPGRRSRPSTAKITVPPGARRKSPSSKLLQQEGEASDESPGWSRALRSGTLLLLGGLILGYLGLMFLARQGIVSLGREPDAAVQQPPDEAPPEPGAPIAPAELAAKALSATEVELSWKDNSEAETGFVVERREGAGDWQKMNTVDRDATGFRDGKLTPETKYAYRVRAEGQGGSSKPSEEVSVTTLAGDAAPRPKLAAPGGLEAKELQTAGEIQLTWKHEAKEGTSFVVERRKAGAFEVKLVKYTGSKKQPRIVPADAKESFRVGAPVPIDKPDHKWTKVPPEMSGAARLFTSHADRGAQGAAERYEIRVSAPCTVYLPVPPSYSGKKMSWMKDLWQDSGNTCESVNVGKKVTWKIWARKVASAGPVTMGSNPKPTSGCTPYFFVPLAPGRPAPFTVKLVKYNGKAQKPVIAAAGSKKDAFKSGAIAALGSKNTVKSVPPALEGKTRLLTDIEKDGTEPLGAYVVSVSAPCRVYVMLHRKQDRKGLPWKDKTWEKTELLGSHQFAGEGWWTNYFWKKDIEAGEVPLNCDPGRSISYIFAPKAGASKAPGADKWTAVATVEKGATSCKDTGLAPGTKYEYRVCARKEGGESPWSATASITVPPAVGPAGVLTAKLVSPTEVELTWKGTFAEKGTYGIDRNKKKEGWKQVGELKKGNFTFKDVELEPNTRYSYMIRAVLPGGEKVSKAVTLTTPAKVAPVIVGELSARPVSTTAVELTWKGLPVPVPAHTVEYQDKPGAEWKKGQLVRSKEGSSRTMRLAPDTEYSFRIRVNSAPPKYTEVATARTLATGGAHPAAGELTAKALSDTAIELTWKGTVVEKTTYKLGRKPGTKSPGWEWQDKLKIGAPKLTDAGLKPETEYTYRVHIAGRAGHGVSKEIKVRTLAKGQKVPPPGAPAAPSKLKAAVGLPNRITLTWKDNSKDETNFDIERAYSSDDLLRVGPTVKYGGTARRPYVAPAGSGQSFLPRAVVSHNLRVRWSEVPHQLWGKARLVTAYEDSGAKNGSKLYVVNVSGPCTVYRLAPRETGGKRPRWITDTWKDSGLTCKSVDAARKFKTWHLWKKTIKAAGPVTLPCHPQKKKSAAPYVFASDQMRWRPVASIGRDRQTYEDSVRISVQCFYRVRATNIRGKSAFSEVISVVIPRRKLK